MCKNYLKKEDIKSTVEDKINLLSEEGWTTKDIQTYFRISYKKALEIFKDVEKKCGTVEFDRRQVRTADIIQLIKRSTPEKEIKRLALVGN